MLTPISVHDISNVLMKLYMLNREYIYYCRIFEVKSGKTRLIKNILLKHIKGVFFTFRLSILGMNIGGFCSFPPPPHTHLVRPWTILLANISYFCDADFPSFCFVCMKTNYIKVLEPQFASTAGYVNFGHTGNHYMALAPSDEV